METHMASERFADRVVFITGATSGIGRELARAFASEGARVVGTGRDQARLAALAPEVEVALTLDVTDSRSVEVATRAALDRLGRVDVLVNNAGIGLFKPWEDTTIEDVQRILDVNLLGAVRMTRALLPGMVERADGAIVNVASVAGLRGYPEHTAYCASKHALVGWSRALRKDLRGSGVSVVTICPPAVNTPFFANAGFPDFRERHRGLSLMSPEAVAKAIVDATARGEWEVVLSARARALRVLDRVAPRLLDRLQDLKR